MNLLPSWKQGSILILNRGVTYQHIEAGIHSITQKGIAL